MSVSTLLCESKTHGEQIAEASPAQLVEYAFNIDGGSCLVIEWENVDRPCELCSGTENVYQIRDIPKSTAVAEQFVHACVKCIKYRALGNLKDEASRVRCIDNPCRTYSCE